MLRTVCPNSLIFQVRLNFAQNYENTNPLYFAKTHKNIKLKWQRKSEVTLSCELFPPGYISAPNAL